MNAYGSIEKYMAFARDTNYLPYIPIMYHWHDTISIPKVWGFPSTPWGIAYIIQSDYTNFHFTNSKTFICATITYVDIKSPFTGKTANQSSRVELISEVLRQLKTTLGNLPYPDVTIIEPNIVRNSNDTQWIWRSKAYIHTAQYPIPIKAKSDTLNNCWHVGTHNGRSAYSFTSMESATSNAVAVVKELLTPIEFKNLHLNVRTSWTVRNYLSLLLFVVIFLFLL
jgi:hypothetical protein